MIFTLQQEIIFIPTANGNDALPKEEQITVKIKRPTYKEHSELTNVQCIIDKDNDKQMRFDTQVNYEKIIMNHVVEITNLTIDNGKGSIEIKTGKDLIMVKGTTKAFRDLVDEIGQAVMKDSIGSELSKN
jgi:hypothetical protein